MVARLHGAHFGTDRTHDPGGLMPRNGGQGVGVMPVDEVQVRMAQPAGLGIDQDFVRAGLGIGDFGDAKALSGGFENGGFCHDNSSPLPLAGGERDLGLPRKSWSQRGGPLRAHAHPRPLP